MARSVKGATLRVRPSRPSVNKWSKRGPVLDFMLPLMCLAGLFKAMWEELSSPNNDKDHLVDLGPDLDDELVSELAFAALNGKRYHSVRRYIGEGWSLAHMLMLALVLEPLRYLSSFWTRRARACDDPRTVASLDMVSLGFSPVVIALQYIGGMMSGTGARLMLLWRRSSSTYVE